MHRLMLLLIAALMLGGCNLVVSEHPMFFPRDAKGAAQFRPGVWAERKADCQFDSSKPVTEWPECAGGGVLTRDTLVARDDKEKDSKYILAAGEPRIMQFDFRADDKPGGKVLYLFLGVEPVRLDDKGRIVEARMWLAQCGPLPPKPSESETSAAPAETAAAEDGAPTDEQDMQRQIDAAVADSVTKEPFEGLTIQDGMCIPRDQEAVRNAAARSLGISKPEDVNTLYWVRDGRR